MTDWQTCSVVRDRDGDLWGSAIAKGERWWANLGYFVSHTTDELEHHFGPITPVLDANGLPVVTTVGDLTARHIGRRVRVNGTVRNIISVAHTRDGSTVLHLQPGSRSNVCLETASVAPCEVLP